MRELFESVASGKPVSPLGSQLYMYGIYLSHGGTPEGYAELDQDDLDLMFLAHSALEAHRHHVWMEGMIKVIKALFGKKG